MNRNTITVVLGLLLILCFATPMLQLGILATSQKKLNLYYESKDATAPVVIKFSGVVSEYQQDYRSFFRALRGVVRGWYSPLAEITLKIGEHYATTEQASCKITRERKTDEIYKCVISATFEVSANEVVPYMVISNIEETEETGQGTLPYEVTYTLNINDVYSRTSTKDKGTAYIQIVGDITDYLPPTDDQPGEPEEVNEDEDLPLDDSDKFGVSGGSKIYSEIVGVGSWVWLLIGTGIIVIGLGLYRRKR